MLQFTKDDLVKKVKYVDKAWKNLELDDLIKNTSMEKKLLFYDNNFDFENNRFCCEYEFLSLEVLKFANAICSTDEKYKLFMEKFYSDNENIVKALKKFQQYINAGQV